MFDELESCDDALHRLEKSIKSFLFKQAKDTALDAEKEEQVALIAKHLILLLSSEAQCLKLLFEANALAGKSRIRIFNLRSVNFPVGRNGSEQDKSSILD